LVGESRFLTDFPHSIYTPSLGEPTGNLTILVGPTRKYKCGQAVRGAHSDVKVKANSLTNQILKVFALSVENEIVFRRTWANGWEKKNKKPNPKNREGVDGHKIRVIQSSRDF
jgi:hypothetical protein